MRTIYQTIYKKLLRLSPSLLALNKGDALKSKSEGYMDLNLDVLQKNSDHMVIALSHYYSANGDMIADPDMEIKIYPSLEAAEALTYQDAFGYQVVYPDENHVIPKIKKDLNIFLNIWLRNCLRQSHSL